MNSIASISNVHNSTQNAVYSQTIDLHSTHVYPCAQYIPMTSRLWLQNRHVFLKIGRWCDHNLQCLNLLLYVAIRSSSSDFSQNWYTGLCYDLEAELVNTMSPAVIYSSHKSQSTKERKNIKQMFTLWCVWFIEHMQSTCSTSWINNKFENKANQDAKQNKRL